MYPCAKSTPIPEFMEGSWFTKSVRYLTRPLVAVLVALFILANGGGWPELAIGAAIFVFIDLASRQVLKRRKRS
jgi:predicted PurR-regulated permease PerM